MRMIVAACALVFAPLDLSCSDDAEKIKITVICNGAPFSGWYDADGNVEYFSDESQSGVIYSSTITLEDVEEVEVDITTGDEANSLTAKIYRDGEKVKSSNTYSTYGSVLYLNVTYTLGEEDSEDEE
ncbi:MAG: hypothetical protein EPN93_06240 [Spirochaetes bacterium]|nr:MAG: hypothetical protein EPN93_06240 [Spirochaetota bacterium]